MMMRKLLAAAGMALTLAAGAVSATPDAQAKTRVYVNTWIGGPIYPGMIVYGEPGWLPYPYYAYPVSMFDDVWRIGVWRRSVRTNITNGFNHRVRRGRVAVRVSCRRARARVRRAGFRRVRAHDCKGSVYGFTGWRGGRRHKVTVSARTGRILRIR